MDIVFPLLLVLNLVDQGSAPELLPTTPIAADVTQAAAGRHHFNLSVDGPLTLLAGVGALGLNRGQAGTDPLRSPVLGCKWCDETAAGATSLNGLDRWAGDARWKENPGKADSVSDAVYVLAGVGVGAPLVFRKDTWSQRFQESGVMLQAASMTLLATNVTKVIARRARPFTHDGPSGRAPISDDNWSFFSGHTALSFSIVTASRSMAASRGATTSKCLWTWVGFPVASTIGYMRIAAGKHYLTDVLVGAAVGVGVGTLVPRLHFGEHERQQATIVLRPVRIGHGVEVLIIW